MKYEIKMVKLMVKIAIAISIFAIARPMAVRAAEEITFPIMLYTETDVVEIAQVVAAEARGRDATQKAAVAWCVLNRVDAWNTGIYETVNQSGAFVKRQPTDEDLIIARDVLDRWSFEKQGFIECGRVLPATYKYFSGDGKANRFREEFRSTEHYDWSLISPYI